MFTRRQTFSLFAGATAALALPGLARAAAAEPAKAFRIGWQKGGVLSLAKQQGAIEKRLADRGIAVSWNEFTSGPPLLEALGAGALDFGSTGDVPAVFAQAAGANMVLVAAGLGGSGSAIVVNKDAPINTLADLKGKEIAYKRGSAAHNFVVKALEKAGLTLADITSLDLAPPDAAPAFASGQVDAWAIWDPYFAIAQQNPATRVLTTTDGIVPQWGFYQANGDFAKANPHVVADVIDELAKAGAWSQAHLDETIKAVSAATGVPEPITRVTLTRPGADLGHVYPLTADAVTYQQGLADEFYKLKIIPKALTVKDIVWYPPTA